MKKRGSLFSLLFLIFSFGLGAQTAEQLFQAGSKAFQDRLYYIATKNFRAVADEYPEHALADDAEYLQGLSEYHLERFVSSIAIFKKFRLKYPRSPYLSRNNFWIGSAYFKQGQYSQGVKYLSTQIEEYPEEEYFLTQALFMRGAALENLERWQQARASYAKLLLLETGLAYQARALLRIGGIFFRLKEYRPALDSFTRILIDHSESEFVGEALFFTAECYFHLGQLNNAEARFRRTLETVPRTTRREDIYFRLLQADTGLNRLDQALAWCQRLEDEFPRGRYTPNLAGLKADLLFDLERFAEAARAYQQAAGVAADSVEKQAVAYNLGLSLLFSDRPMEALEPLGQAALATDRPDIAEKSLYRLGSILQEMGRDNAAISALEQFGRRFPASVMAEEAQSLLGSLYEHTENYSQAVKIFSQLITRYPTSGNHSEYLFRRGSSALAAGDGSAALNDFFRIVRNYPDSVYGDKCRYNIGYIYSTRGEYLRAVPYYQEVLLGKERELSDRALLAIGVAYFNAGEYSEAAAQFKEMSGSYTSWSGEVWFYLARSQYKLEELEEAAESFKRAGRHLEGGELGEEALYWQALSAFRLGHLQDARENFLDLTVRYSSGRRVFESYYRAGLCDSLRERYAESLKLFHLALSLANPMEELMPDLLYQKGWSLLRVDRRKDALYTFESLSRRYSQSDLAREAWYSLAEADFQEGHYSQAAEGFQRVAKDYPHSGSGRVALYWAAVSAEKLSKGREALDYYFRYIEAAPQGGLVAQASNRIRHVLSQSGNRPIIVDFYARVEKSASVPMEIKNQVRFEYARFIFRDDRDQGFRILVGLHDAGVEKSLQGEVDFLIAEYYSLEREFDRALDIFTGITAGFSGRLAASAQLRVAGILAQSGAGEEAAEEYLKVYFLYPDISGLAAEGLFKSAQIFHRLGEQDRAFSLVKKLREEFPESSWAETPLE